MRRLLLLTLMVDYGGGGGQTASSEPVISNLSYWPKSAMLNQGGGFVTVNGTLEFSDQDGDVSELTITTRDAATCTQLSNLTAPITGPQGIASGVVSISVVSDTTIAGDYLFDIMLKDAAGNVSNTLTGIFKVGS